MGSCDVNIVLLGAQQLDIPEETRKNSLNHYSIVFQVNKTVQPGA